MVLEVIGLTHYMVIDRKPENGCEIQNPACGKMGIMMSLHIVKGLEEEVLEGNDDNEDLGHGCKVMLHLLHEWTSAKWRIVCADSYYASTQAAIELYKHNFRFIGVIKTATCLFPQNA